MIGSWLKRSNKLITNKLFVSANQCEVSFSKAFSTAQSNTPLNQNASTKSHSIYSFGVDKDSQLGLDSVTLQSSQSGIIPQKIKAFTLDNTYEAFGMRNKKHRFINVAASHLTNFAINDQYEVFSWGKNDHYQLGLFGNLDQQFDEPTFIRNLKPFRISQVSTGGFHTLFLTKSKKVFSCGHNEHGQVGRGFSDDNNVKKSEQVVSVIDDFKESRIQCIHAGLHESFAASNNEVWSWGLGVKGKLGHDNLQTIAYPKKINTLKDKNIIQIVSGNNFTIFLDADGSIYFCGDYAQYEYGDGNELGNILTPKKIKSKLIEENSITSVAAGESHILALTNKQEVLSWGSGLLCGVDTSKQSVKVPTLIEAFKNIKIKKIGANFTTSFALTDDNKLYSWGLGDNGKLGHLNEQLVLTPKLVEVFKDKKVVDFAIGLLHSLVVVEDQ